MINFNVITLFPQLFLSHIENLPFKKAIEKNLATYNFSDLKNFSTNNYGSVDDKTYGGGVGMVVMVEPIFKSLSEIYGKDTMEKRINGGKDVILEKNSRIVLLSPRGETYSQKKAEELLRCDQITLICGRYEGVDARVEINLATDVVSVGDYILSGGEIPALAIMESVTRLIPGVLEKEEASRIESFSNSKESKYIEYPQYTRPENFMGIKVPEVLLSGNHAEIEKWRAEKSRRS